MGILKKIWYWLFRKKEVETYEDIKAKALKDVHIECNGGYIGNNVNYVAPEEFYKAKGIRREGTKIKGGVSSTPTTPRPEFTPPPQNPTRDFKWEADEHFRQQQARREADDNFLTGAVVGYVIADSLNDNSSYRDVEETKPSSYSSSYDSDSSSSYDSGSYSSSSDSGSSSSCSCDSGC